MKIKFIRVDSRKVGYFDVGKGQPLLLLHGWSACKESFIPIIEQLRDSYRLIAPDLPGHGDTQELRCEHNLDNLVDFIGEFIREIGLKRVSVFGTSVGATLALRLAVEKAGLVDCLVVQAPAYCSRQIREGKIVPRLYSDRMLHPLILLLSKSGLVRKLFFEGYTKKRMRDNVPEIIRHTETRYKKAIKRNIDRVLDIYVNHTSSRALVESGLGIIFLELSPSLNEVDNRTLILWGSEDNLLDPRWGQTLHKILPRSRLNLIEGATHFMVLERPTTVSESIREFLS